MSEIEGKNQSATESVVSEDEPIIVIGRQAGSGGHAIGMAVAKILGVPYYDKELLKECAKRFGYNSRIFELADEKRPSLFRSFMSARYGVGYSSPLHSEGIYQTQSSVIAQLGQEGPCVIIGRTADYILRDHPALFSVFLHAPEEYRANEILKRGDAATHEEAVAKLRKIDARRKDYYNYFTPGGWGEARNYDMCLDSSRFEADTLGRIIVQLAQSASRKGTN